ncbi:MAG: Shedu immune nuclease family protein [Pirellulaceae bacterium]
MSEDAQTETQPCDLCRDVIEHPDVPHVKRRCKQCGREMCVVEPGEHGKGIKVQAGDQFVIPAGWIKLSMDPLATRAVLSREGLQMLANNFFIDDLHRKEQSYEEAAAEMERQMDLIVNESPHITPLDVNNAEHGEQIAMRVRQHPDTAEFWAFLAGMFLAQAREARTQNDIVKASWATACAERFRMMVVYKQQLETAVWMGHSAKRLVAVLAEWNSNQTNSSEEFWQLTFDEHSYVLSQVFAVPVVFVQEKAYVGGTMLDRTGGKYLDYLFAAEVSSEVLLVEIKTPTARLLGSEYRSGVYGPSSELGGAVVQALTYRNHLTQDLKRLTEGTPHDLKAFNPRTVVVIGNSKVELVDHATRRSFELFRASCEVEIVTFDELFRKVEVLAHLFGLVPKAATNK